MDNVRTILDELFEGNIQPFAKLKVTDHEYKSTNEMINEEKENWLMGLLSDEDKKRYEKLEAMNQNVSVMEQNEAFKQGFRLAVMLLTEAFYTKDKLVEKEN